jgi:hypothetical protein
MSFRWVRKGGVVYLALGMTLSSCGNAPVATSSQPQGTVLTVTGEWARWRSAKPEAAGEVLFLVPPAPFAGQSHPPDDASEFPRGPERRVVFAPAGSASSGTLEQLAYVTADRTSSANCPMFEGTLTRKGYDKLLRRDGQELRRETIDGVPLTLLRDVNSDPGDVALAAYRLEHGWCLVAGAEPSDGVDPAALAVDSELPDGPDPSTLTIDGPEGWERVVDLSRQQRWAGGLSATLTNDPSLYGGSSPADGPDQPTFAGFLSIAHGSVSPVTVLETGGARKTTFERIQIRGADALLRTGWDPPDPFDTCPEGSHAEDSAETGLIWTSCEPGEPVLTPQSIDIAWLETPDVLVVLSLFPFGSGNRTPMAPGTRTRAIELAEGLETTDEAGWLLAFPLEEDRPRDKR